jgi:DNA polymerase-3 subunit epsilon
MLERLALSWGADDMALRMAGDGVLSLEAAGGMPDAGRLTGWLATPLSPGLSGFSGRDVLICHGSTLTATALPDGRAALRLTLALAGQKPAQATPAILYDFDLLQTEVPRELSQARLRKLSFVIFDTETTGLDPMTDEVVQLGAVRVVNGKVVSGEVFETLVNPGIPIPKRSADVHGISNAMVKDAPGFDDVCAKFHAFAADSVFVAHNAAFDMAFLHKQAPRIDRRFDHPVMDTVLMSAAVFGGSAVHTLDAICDRLGIVIPDAHRHTAMGDAVATANAMIAMIAIFEGRGIQTYGALQTEMSRHQKILKT